jgi:hypothetical protein
MEGHQGEELRSSAAVHEQHLGQASPEHSQGSGLDKAAGHNLHTIQQGASSGPPLPTTKEHMDGIVHLVNQQEPSLQLAPSLEGAVHVGPLGISGELQQIDQSSHIELTDRIRNGHNSDEAVNPFDRRLY